MQSKSGWIGLAIGAALTAIAAAHDEEPGTGKGSLTSGGGGSLSGTIFSSFKIDQLGHIPKADLLDQNATGSQRGSDIWGWTDSAGAEYTLVGLSDGTAFVDISDPVNLGRLPSHTGTSAWRDIKTYNAMRISLPTTTATTAFRSST